MNHRPKLALFILGAGLAAAPARLDACACGCGVFDVATSSMLPEGSGGMAFLEYDYQDQNVDWSGGSSAPAADNPDKEIRTDFFTLGTDYFFNRSWGIEAEIPVDHRYFQTTGGPTGNEIVSLNWSTLGDIRVEGVYTGFSPDQSIGVTFGLKLPTGNYHVSDGYPDIDRDSELGTGSTDILLGGFFRRSLGDSAWTWYGQLQMDQPVLSQDQYRPGAEADAASGVYFEGFAFRGVHFVPIAQMIVSLRESDTGDNAADPVASGYKRLMLSPGAEVKAGRFSVYGDLEYPVLQTFTGYQLSARVLCKVIVSCRF